MKKFRDRVRSIKSDILSHWNDKMIAKFKELMISQLGWNGRMIGASKSGYRDRNPENIVVFNANIIMHMPCIKDHKHIKVWYGDLDLSKDSTILASIAKETNSDLYVLYEMDGRFENELDPQVSNALVCFESKSGMQIGKNNQAFYEVVNNSIRRKKE